MYKYRNGKIGGVNMSKKLKENRVLDKILASILILCLTLVNSILVASYLTNGIISYAAGGELENQELKIANGGMEFDAYYFCLLYTSTGTNQLIKQGAILVTSPKEIIKEYKEKQKYNMSKAIQKTRPVPKAYEAIYKEIGQDPISIELLYKKMDININEINSILTMLELEGFIQQLPGKTFIRKEGGG